MLLSEVLSPLQWIGVSLTLISIYLINQREILANDQTIVPEEKLTNEQKHLLEACASSLKPVAESKSVDTLPSN